MRDLVELPMDSQYYMESLYKYLGEVHEIRIVRGRDTLEAALPSLEVQKFLEIDAQMPVFKRTRQTFLPGEDFPALHTSGKDGLRCV